MQRRELRTSHGQEAICPGSPVPSTATENQASSATELGAGAVRPGRLIRLGSYESGPGDVSSVSRPCVHRGHSLSERGVRQGVRSPVCQEPYRTLPIHIEGG